MPLVDINAALAESAVTWADLRWIREVWKGPIVIKGVLTADDARRSVDEGAAAISVSNHGGRQLDGVPASLRALPEVVEAVQGRIEVLMDGGIRRGTDIAKALCMGAQCGAVRTRLCLWFGRGRRSWRRSRHRDPARRSGANFAVARLCIGHGIGSLVRERT